MCRCRGDEERVGRRWGCRVKVRKVRKGKVKYDKPGGKKGKGRLN